MECGMNRLLSRNKIKKPLIRVLVSRGVWKLEMVVETNAGPKLTDELRGSIPLQATKHG